MTEGIDLRLTAAEALVLFEWLARTDLRGVGADDAERRVLEGVECALEDSLVEPLSPDYLEHLAEARRTVLGHPGAGAATDEAGAS